MELIEFLQDCIAEDRAAAEAATQSAKWWDWPGREGHREASVRAHEDPYIALNLTNGDAAHIARHDPARVLAECEAKRRIVQEFDRLGSMPADGMADGGAAAMAIMDGLEIAMRALALPYADRPGYSEEWRPSA